MGAKNFLLVTLFMFTVTFSTAQIAGALSTPAFLMTAIVGGATVASFYILTPRFVPEARFKARHWVPLLLFVCAVAALVDWWL